MTTYFAVRLFQHLQPGALTQASGMIERPTPLPRNEPQPQLTS